MAFPKYYKKDIHVFVCSNNVESLGACFGFEDAVGGKNSQVHARTGMRTSQEQTCKHRGLPCFKWQELPHLLASNAQSQFKFPFMFTFIF